MWSSEVTLVPVEMSTTPTWSIRGEPVQASRALALRLIEHASTRPGVLAITGTGPMDGDAAFRGIELASGRVNVVTLDRAGVSRYWHPRLKRGTPNRPMPSQVAELGFTLLAHASFGGLRLLAESSNLPEGGSWSGGLLVKEAPEGLWLVTGPTFVEGQRPAASR